MTVALAPLATGRNALKPIVAPALENHAPSVYLASLAAGSRRPMRVALDCIARILTGGRCDMYTLPWPRLRFQHTAAIRAALMERYAIKTVNQRLSALKGVLKAAWQLQQISTDDYMRAVAIRSVRGQALPRGRALSTGELLALFQQCAEDGGNAGARDAALLGVLYGGGLRRSEAVTLDLNDYDEWSGELRVRLGKGGTGRTLYIFEGAADAVAGWLAVRGRSPGPLFYALTKNASITGRRLNPQGVFDMLRRRGDRAGLRHFAPHDFRRTLISHLLERGADLVTVQKIVGHKNVNTTSGYDRRDEGEKQKAARLLHVPFVRMKS